MVDTAELRELIITDASLRRVLPPVRVNRMIYEDLLWLAIHLPAAAPPAHPAVQLLRKRFPGIVPSNVVVRSDV